MNLWLVLPGLAVVALGFVMLPVGVAMYRHYRTLVAVRCPVKQAPASVKVDANRAAMAAAFGLRSLRIINCSFWPEQRGCAGGCLEGREEPLPSAVKHTA